jgi:chloramphenicol-sensitive protein RarD
MSAIQFAPTSEERRAGLFAAFGAYALWGVLPVYIKLVGFADARELLGLRILLSIPATLAAVFIVSGLRRGAAELAALFTPRRFGALTFSSLFIFMNWGIYIWLVLEGRVIEASLAYFLAPLVSVALGVAFFGERLSRLQLGALGLAAAGVALQGFALGAPPTMALALCATWSVYALLRKRMPVPAAPGLFAETLALAPLALGMVIWAGSAAPLAFNQNLAYAGLLSLAGPLTALPLMLFAFAARRVSFSALGLLQYVAPSMQFVIGLAYGEPLTPFSAASFVLIWIGLALFSLDAWRRMRTG